MGGQQLVGAGAGPIERAMALGVGESAAAPTEPLRHSLYRDTPGFGTLRAMTTKPALSEPEVFVLADHALNDVVQQIEPDQWAMEVPAWFSRRDMDRTPTLREIINHHAYEDAWVPDMLAGRTMAEVGVDAYKGDLLGEHPNRNFAALVDKACAAATALDDLDRTVHCSFGDFPARGYLWQTNMFRGLRAHDIAKVIGVDLELPAELVQGLWDEISPKAEEWRAIGVFGKAVPVPRDAPLMDRVLGLTGRDPNET
jgi:uncharacterized protein (TIGR03086 family)